MENSAFPGAAIDAPPDSSLLMTALWLAGWIAAAGVPALIARFLSLNPRVYFGASLLLSPIGGLFLIALIRTPANEAAALRTFGKHWLKPVVLIALIAPFAYLALQWGLMLAGQPHAMGWNVGQWTHRYLGDTAIRILLLTLAVSPVRDITGWGPIALIRRRVGLAAFFYAALHLLAYFWLDRNWSIAGLIEDVTLRTYIMLGMAALTLLIPLAITSTNGMIKRLGRKAWDRLHWLIYPLAILAVAHNLLMVKAIDGAPTVHAMILALLLGWRVARWMIGKLKPAEATA
jgi:methionine sulfoxide reductase heme-binding subunit